MSYDQMKPNEKRVFYPPFYERGGVKNKNQRTKNHFEAICTIG